MKNTQPPQKSSQFDLSIKPQRVAIADGKPNDAPREARVVVVTAC